MRRPTIRTQLLVLALAAILPVGGAAIYAIVDASRTSLALAEGEMQNLAATAANEVEERLAESEQILSRLAQRPLVRAVDPRRCDPIIAEFAKLHPDYTNLAIRDVRGNSICSLLRVPPASMAVKFPWFEEGIRSSGFVAGDAILGEASGRWFSALTYPLRDEKGAVTGVLAMGVDLLKLQRRILPTASKDMVVSVIDRQAKFLMRSENPEQWIGRGVSNPDNVREAQRHAEGSYRIRGVDGVPRYFAYRTVAKSGWLVSVGIPEATLFAPHRRRLWTAVGIVAGTLLLALFLVRRVGGAVAKPVRDLEAATERVSAGDIRARAPIGGPAEVANVAIQFNRMLDTREAAESALRQSEQRFRSVVSAMAEGVVLQDADGRIVSCNPSAERILGLGFDQMTGRTSRDPRWRAIHEDGSPFPGETHPAMATLRSGEPCYDVIMGIRTPDGTLRWISINTQPIPGEEPSSPNAVVSSFRDITDRKIAEARIGNLNRVYAVLSRINGLIVRVGERMELFRESCRIAVEAGQFRMAWIGIVNREADAVTPLAWDGDVRDFFEIAPLAITQTRPGGHGLAGQAVREMKAVVSNDIENDPQRIMKKEMKDRGIASLAVLPLIVSGKVIGVLALYAAEVGFFDEEEMKLLTELAGDISLALDHIEKAERLEYVAYYDVLTGLANRALFHERLTQRLRIAGHEQNGLALVLLDVDRFKNINDSLGRLAGDELLRQVAKRLGEHARDASLIGRIEADRFAVMIPGIRQVDDVARIVEEQSRVCFGTPFRLGETELRLSTKGGMAVFPGDGTDAETLYRNAESAHKKARAAPERYLFYDQQMTDRVAERLNLENKLQLALERGEFVLHYQPKVDLETRSIQGVEALIRWQSVEFGLVPPMHFIPLLEETGMILEVGAWAMRRAAIDHRAWLAQGTAAPRVAVNVSPIQLRRRDFVHTLRTALAEGASAAGLDLEITETVIMEDIEAMIEKLAAIRDMGVGIAVDDFGTGYSSLRYLAKLPVQTVKIDRSFVSTMLNDANTMSLVSTIISLAHSLKLKVVAEGVDSEEQAAVLRTLACDQMQGYLISKPLPLKELSTLLSRGKAPAHRAMR
jgi:diguanylate cyclase (GGDEF)-like protein/PAS domain S-box-containing protein